MWELKALSPEEEATPYSKYYYMEFPEPVDMLDFVANPRAIDPASALPIQRLNDMLNPGRLAAEVGYCVMPDGSGFVAENFWMPGVTVEMWQWWFAWFVSEDLRYKIWHPRDHAGSSVSDEDHAMLYDPNVPRERKLRNPAPSHLAIESIGAGVERIWIERISPEDFGFDMSRYKHPDVATTVCSNITVPPADPRGHPGDIAMVHFVRELPGGIEIRNRFWLGYRIIDKQPVLMLPPGSQVKEQTCFGLFEHDIHEFSRLAGFLPQLYAEEQGRVN